MAYILRILLVWALIYLTGAAEDFKDFDINSDEVMIAQESRQYQTVIKPAVKIVKPTGVTNSHRPQYNLDSLESDGLDLFQPTTKRSLVRNYKSSAKIRSEGMVKEAVLRALERKDDVGKFSQILPIIRAMSGSQRVALASLVASQVTAVPGTALNLTQVRTIIGDNANTTEIMLPLLYDTANLIRRAVKPGTDTRQVKQPQMLRRTFVEDSLSFDTTTQGQVRHRIRRIIPPRTLTNTTAKPQNITNNNHTEIIDRTTRSSLTTEPMSSSAKLKSISSSRAISDNSTLDLMADSTNQSLAQELPVAEKLRALNRYVDRKVPGSIIRRGTYPPKPVTRRPTVEPGASLSRRRPLPARKLPSLTGDPTKCDLFTNTLCLHSEDYPTDAIVQSIRRNKAAAGALLADFKDPGEGALDGVTADQEAKYTADHYLVSNRRGDTANRDFAGAGEAGFMCPSTVKYARPQRARATSGQWKYIVNTGEHTQTLRLEKCLKPKESCTYLTDNFKSKCVQVYNYHRLLTWDQQNGLHMDIFKVPTCCSCHIEGYSVSFPPLGHRIHETSSEHFPGEDLSAEHGNNAFEAVQSTIQRPRVKSPPFTQKPLDSFSPFSDKQNLINGPFGKISDNDDANQLSSSPIDSYGNTYFPDSFNQASSVKSIKRPPTRNSVGNSFDSVTLPSYLEPPTPSATSSFSFIKDPSSKFKGSPFKRGAIRPRPIRKKISGGLDDLSSSGSTALESLTSGGVDSSEAFADYIEESRIDQASVANIPQLRVTIAPKLHSVTTEVHTVTPLNDNTNAATESFSSNGKKVNYNYHPIIDFFENVDKNDDQSIDRGDSEASYRAQIESGWKPIKHPPARSIQSTDLIGTHKKS